uniref:Secreted protein n=1 Tax=Rhizophora mucronata TaxID=61149 RepID=A0A2P2IUD3_RHIMU
MTVLSDSSACLSLSFLAALAAPESTAPEKRLACLEEEEQEEEEEQADFKVESHFGACSFIPCATLIPTRYNTLLSYLKLIRETPNSCIWKRKTNV